MRWCVVLVVSGLGSGAGTLLGFGIREGRPAWAAAGAVGIVVGIAAGIAVDLRMARHRTAPR